MKNNWPTTMEELVDECERLESRYDLYTLGEKGEPFHGESEPRVDGTKYLAGEHQYGVAMVPAQWVTSVLDAATVGGEHEPMEFVPKGATTNPRGTCVVLQGEKPPEEVLFVRDEGGVTHYLPEETCHMRLAYEEEDADGCIWPDHYECDACGAKVNGIMPFYDTEIPPKSCPNCGRRVIKEETE